jgi:hypothetical protein
MFTSVDRVTVPVFGCTVYIAVPDPVPEPDTVTQEAVVVAVQAQPACVVTVIEPDVPVGGAVIPEGESANVQDGLPASVTVNDFPAMVRVAALDRALVLGATLNVTVPDPVPLAPPEIVTHVAPLDAVQVQFADVVTVTVPGPPPVGKVWLVGEIVNEHDVAGWVTENVLPAIVIVPVRDVEPVFGATV